MHRQTRIQLALVLMGLSILGPVYLFKSQAFSSQFTGIAGIVISCGVYLYMLYEIQKIGYLELDLKFILFSTVLLRLATIPTPIFGDDYIYRAIWDGWIQQMGMNPYANIPAADALSMIHGSTLYQLLNHTEAFASSPPILEIFYRFIGIIYDQFGLGTTILVHKGLALLIDVGIVLSLVKWARMMHVDTNPLLYFAWNPFWIIFITGQGIMYHLAALIFVWVMIEWERNSDEMVGLLWGGVLACSPLGWLGLPYLFLRYRWKIIVYSLLTYIIWWLPFLFSTEVLNYFTGIAYMWIQPIPHLSLGYGLSELLRFLQPTIVSMAFIGILIVLGLGICYDAYRLKRIDLETFLHRMLIAGLIYYLAMPSLNIGLLSLLILLPVFYGRYIYLSAILSTLLFFEIWFFYSNNWWAPMIFSAVIVLIVAIRQWDTKTELGFLLRE